MHDKIGSLPSGTALKFLMLLVDPPSVILRVGASAHVFVAGDAVMVKGPSGA
jgi:hypothetical protein